MRLPARRRGGAPPEIRYPGINDGKDLAVAAAQLAGGRVSNSECVPERVRPARAKPGVRFRQVVAPGIIAGGYVRRQDFAFWRGRPAAVTGQRCLDSALCRSDGPPAQPHLKRNAAAL